MNKKINAALISVFYKEGLETLVPTLHQLGVTLYSTGGTQTFIENLGIPVKGVETLTNYPSILGGRVKTLHPAIFGGILGKRNDTVHQQEMVAFNIPEIDLVIVDLYPFQETVALTSDEKQIIEKIDIGGPSMIRAAAKNFADVAVISSKKDYSYLNHILLEQQGQTTLDQRRWMAAKAFMVVEGYDEAISNYFTDTTLDAPFVKSLRYGENPHQKAIFKGNLAEIFTQMHGKDLSYNNLVDVDAAVQLMADFESSKSESVTFAIIKHTNVCGIAQRPTTHSAWGDALAGDPESAFGGVLITNGRVDEATALAIQEIFFEVLMAPDFEDAALAILKSKKNRILLQIHSLPPSTHQVKSMLGGKLTQQIDAGNTTEWNEVGGRPTTADEKSELLFANLIAKHLKSNAIALTKNRQLIGKGAGQTSRVDALRHAIEKARQFSFELDNAVLASDAFFPFDDCVRIAHAEGITAFIQPGGSIRDKDSIAYCVEHKLAMVMTGMRHFKH